MTKRAEDCRLHPKKPQANGYVKLSYKGQAWLAHRLAYVVNFGKIPNGKMVLHKCDVRNCVNPKHLYAGTYKDNAHDCLNHKRHLL